MKKKKQLEVVILRGSYNQDIEKQINKHLNDGWELRGSLVGATASDGAESWMVTAQMMVREKPTKRECDIYGIDDSDVI